MTEQIRTITEAARAMQAGRLTPVELVEHCLQQIDRHEPQVRAWVMVDRAGARAEAVRLTEELQRGQYRGPLHGIPLGVKDIFDVFDWPTAAGSKLWADSIARHDCDVVAHLRQAGAIFLGKTVTTAYASFDPPVTRNPWNHARTPGGSSSGSAAAVAAGMCLGALASQTGGSIARPAAYCGVCGLKPTYGRLSLHGIVPLAESMDHPGFMANSASDLAILLQATADVDGRVIDGWEVPGPDEYVTDIDALPDMPEAGIFRGMFTLAMEPEMRAAFDDACDRFYSAGMQLVDFPLPAAFADITARHQLVMAVEAAEFHETRFRRHPEDYPPKITSLIQEGLKASAPEYARTKEHQQALKAEILDAFVEGVTVALTPTTAGTAPDAATTGLPVMNSPWSYLGLPTVNIPMAWSSDGLPLSLQLVAKPFEEALLLQMANWCETVLQFERRTPAGK